MIFIFCPFSFLDSPFFNCIYLFFVTGNPEPTVRWYVNGKLKNDASEEKSGGDIIEKQYVPL